MTMKVIGEIMRMTKARRAFQQKLANLCKEHGVHIRGAEIAYDMEDGLRTNWTALEMDEDFNLTFRYTDTVKTIAGESVAEESTNATSATEGVTVN